MYIGEFSISNAMEKFSVSSFGVGCLTGGVVSVGLLVVWIILSR